MPTKSDPGNAKWQQALCGTLERIGVVRCAQGDFPQALEAYERASGIAERLIQADPADAALQLGLCGILEKIGGVLSAQRRLQHALDAHQSALEIAELLARVDPANAEYQRNLCVCLDRIASVMERQGDPNARTVWRRAHDELKALKDRGARLSPQDEESLQELARKANHQV